MSSTNGPFEPARMGSQDFSAQIAAARMMRAQAAADFLSAGIAALGRAIRPATAPLARPLARWRDLSRLRAAFAGLDDATLRELNIPREMAAEITPEALADHPLAAGDRWRIANENAVAGSRARTAA